GIPIAEEYGGAGADTVSYAIAVEELTRIDSSVAITVAAHTSLGTMPIYLYGSEQQKQEWLPQLASGAKLAAFGLTEPNAGSDAGATRTRAELRDGTWVVDGSKMFITNAGTDITACVTITALTGENEISNIIVPNGTPGYDISPPMRKLGWHASDTRELSFTSCAVPEGNLLGERGRGFQPFMTILDGGRPGEALPGPALEPGRERGAPDPRRLRLHRGVRDLAPLPRPEDPRDRRGHERGAAHGHRSPPRALTCPSEPRPGS